jgi:hypothetical protein
MREDSLKNRASSLRLKEAAVMDKIALTIKETAKTFNFPEFAIRTLVKTGKIPVIQCGTRSYIMKGIFEDFLKSGGEKYDAGKIKKP